MDTGQGKFEEIPNYIYDQAEKEFPMDSMAFKVGELLEIKGSKFKVHAIRPKKMILKLLTRG